MQAAELTAEFGIAGILDFVETEHGLRAPSGRPPENRGAEEGPNLA